MPLQEPGNAEARHDRGAQEPPGQGRKPWGIGICLFAGLAVAGTMPALFGPALKFPAALVVLGVFAATVWGILRLDFDCVVNASAFSPPQRLVILLVAGQVLVALCAFLAAAPGLLSSKLVAFPAMLVMAIWLFVFAGQTTRLSRAEPPSLGLRLGLVAIWMSILGALALLARAT